MNTLRISNCMPVQIIATIGKNINKNKITQMCISGVNIFRYNFSHGNHQDALKLVKIIQELDKEFSVKLMGDLAGAELRIYNYSDNNRLQGLKVKKNQILRLYGKDIIENQPTINLQLEYFNPVSNQVLLMDGLLEAELLEINSKFLEIKFKTDSVLRENAHISFPGSDYPIPFLTEKDIDDISFCNNHSFDYLALSFVKTVDDIKQVKERINNQALNIITKFELTESLRNMDCIIAESDLIFIARGDLGIECGLINVPYLQDLITQQCHNLNTPVFLATQILESMIKSPLPTRAELTDIAYAIKSGVSGLTLSGETAYGKHPIESIKLLKQMILKYSS